MPPVDPTTLQTVTAGVTPFGAWAADTFIPHVGPGAVEFTRAGNLITTARSLVSLPDGHPCICTSSGTLPAGLTSGLLVYGQWTSTGDGPYALYSDRGLTSPIALSDAGTGTHTIRPHGSEGTAIARWWTPQRQLVRGRDGIRGRIIVLFCDHTNGIDHADISLDNGPLLRLTPAKDLVRVRDLYCAPDPSTFTANAAANTITLGTANPDDLTDAPVYIEKVRLSSAGTLPAGLTAGAVYYTRFSSTTTSKLFAWANDAANNVNAIDITDAGTGVHTLTYCYGAVSAYAFLVPADLADGPHALRAYVTPQYAGQVRVLQGMEDATYRPNYDDATVMYQSLQVYGDLSNTLDRYVVISGTGAAVGSPAVQHFATTPDPTTVTGKYATIADATDALFDLGLIDDGCGYKGLTIICEANAALNARAGTYRNNAWADIRPMPGIGPAAVKATVTQNIDGSTANVGGWNRYCGIVFVLDPTASLVYLSGNDTVQHYNLLGCAIIGPGGTNPNGGLFGNDITDKIICFMRTVQTGTKGGGPGPLSMLRGVVASDFSGDFARYYRMMDCTAERPLFLVGEHPDGITQRLGPEINGQIINVEFRSDDEELNSMIQGDGDAEATDCLTLNVSGLATMDLSNQMDFANIATHFVIRHCVFPHFGMEGFGYDQTDDCEISGCVMSTQGPGSGVGAPAFDAGTKDAWYLRMKWLHNHSVSPTLAEASDTTGDPGVDSSNRPTAGSPLLGVVTRPVRKFDLDGTQVGSTDNVGAYATAAAMGAPLTPALLEYSPIRNFTEVDIALQLGSSPSAHGIFYRFQAGSDSGYYLSGDGHLYRVDSRVATSLGSTAAAAQGDTIRVTASGSAHSCYVNGVHKFDATDAGYASGSIGILCTAAVPGITEFVSTNVE